MLKYKYEPTWRIFTIKQIILLIKNCELSQNLRERRRRRLQNVNRVVLISQSVVTFLLLILESINLIHFDLKLFWKMYAAGPIADAPFAAAGPSPCGGAPCGAAPVAVAPPCQENRAFQYNLPPRVTCNADCANRYSQQLYDNNNHIFVTQPVINERNHHVNHLNRTLIRDNNFHHYRQHNLFRDNVINRFYNQVYRQQRNFADYSCSQSVVQGTVTSTPPVNTYHVLPGVSAPCAVPAPAPAPILAAPAPVLAAGPAPILAGPAPGPACGSCAAGRPW